MGEIEYSTTSKKEIVMKKTLHILLLTSGIFGIASVEAEDNVASTTNVATETNLRSMAPDLMNRRIMQGDANGRIDMTEFENLKKEFSSAQSELTQAQTAEEKAAAQAKIDAANTKMQELKASMKKEMADRPKPPRGDHNGHNQEQLASTSNANADLVKTEKATLESKKAELKNEQNSLKSATNSSAKKALKEKIEAPKGQRKLREKYIKALEKNKAKDIAKYKEELSKL